MCVWMWWSWEKACKCDFVDSYTLGMHDVGAYQIENAENKKKIVKMFAHQ